MTTPRQLPLSDTSTFETMHRDLTVAQIATPRDQLETCAREESIAAVQERNTNGYDYLPVEDGGSIVALFHTRPYWHQTPVRGVVGDTMDPLSDVNLIGAEASILDFLRDVDTRPFRLVVSGGGIGGFVAWSDLQKLPVRTALFALITGFELTMYEAIRSRHPTMEDWLSLLKPGRQDKVRETIEKSHKTDSEVDALLYTQFCDKATIVQRCCRLEGSKTLLGRIERLRNKVAHANSYVTCRQDADKACRTVNGLIDLREVILERTKTSAAGGDVPGS